MNEEYMHINQQRWDEMVGVHAKSAFYDVASFKAGRNSLAPLEREELGDVAGKALLHLQCHFGMDTLSWARLGAKVTGVDYHEFPFCGWQYFSAMETGEDGWQPLQNLLFAFVQEIRGRHPVFHELVF